MEKQPEWVGYLGHDGASVHYLREFEMSSSVQFDQLSVSYISQEDKAED